MTIHQKFGTALLCRQIILAPEALRGAGEHRLSARSVAPQLLRQMYDAVEASAGRLAFIFTITLALQLAQGFPGQVFGEDGFFLVGFIARRRGLKVETKSAGSRIFKLC